MSCMGMSTRDKILYQRCIKCTTWKFTGPYSHEGQILTYDDFFFFLYKAPVLVQITHDDFFFFLYNAPVLVHITHMCFVACYCNVFVFC